MTSGPTAAGSPSAPPAPGAQCAPSSRSPPPRATPSATWPGSPAPSPGRASGGGRHAGQRDHPSVQLEREQLAARADAPGRPSAPAHRRDRGLSSPPRRSGRSGRLPGARTYQDRRRGGRARGTPQGTRDPHPRSSADSHGVGGVDLARCRPWARMQSSPSSAAPGTRHWRSLPRASASFRTASATSAARSWGARHETARAPAIIAPDAPTSALGGVPPASPLDPAAGDRRCARRRRLLPQLPPAVRHRHAAALRASCSTPRSSSSSSRRSSSSRSSASSSSSGATRARATTWGSARPSWSTRSCWRASSPPPIR